MGNWKLFIDDLRQPDEGFVLSTSVDDAISLIETQGFPVFISFDHDLGDNCKTGKEFVDLIINQVLDGKWVIPSNFEFQVHSDNPSDLKIFDFY